MCSVNSDLHLSWASAPFLYKCHGCRFLCTAVWHNPLARHISPYPTQPGSKHTHGHTHFEVKCHNSVCGACGFSFTCSKHLILSPGAMMAVVNTPDSIPAANNCGYLKHTRRSKKQQLAGVKHLVTFISSVSHVRMSSGVFCWSIFPSPKPKKHTANMGVTPMIGAAMPLYRPRTPWQTDRQIQTHVSVELWWSGNKLSPLLPEFS